MISFYNDIGLGDVGFGRFLCEILHWKCGNIKATPLVCEVFVYQRNI